MTAADTAVLGARLDSLEKSTLEAIQRVETRVEAIGKRHDECVQRCDVKRAEVYRHVEDNQKRLTTLEVHASAISAKVGFVWGLIGTLVGGGLVFLLLETAKRVMVP